MPASGPAPERIGTYPVERELGRGGMGVVYRARDGRTLVLQRRTSTGWDVWTMSVDGGHKAVPFAHPPVRLFQKDVESGGLPLTRYTVSSDGQRFLLNVPVQNSSVSAFTVVLNRAADARRS